MSERLRVLQVEDSESDAALIARLLQKAGYDLDRQRVEAAEEMRAALARQSWDVLICDYRLPQFDAPAALAVLQETGLDVPFIVVSGTIGEDIAVRMMKSGAHDYLMKDNLARLAPAVEREVREARTRRERMKAEQALRESEERYRLISENTADVIWTFDLASDRFSYVSPSVRRLLGYAPEEILTKTISDMLPPDSRASLVAFQERLKAFLGGDESARIQTAQVDQLRKDGSVVPTEIVTTLLADDQGRPCEIVGVTRDLTERRQAEAALRESSLLNQQIIASARDGIIVYGPDMKYKVWNRFMEELTGYQADEVLGKHPLEVFPFLREAGVLQAIAKAMAGETASAAEFPFGVDRTGKSGWCSDTCGPLRDGNNRIIGVIGVVRDITEQRRAAEEQEKLREQFLQAQKMESVGRLAGGIAHDFNNLLTVINGYSNLILGHLKPGDPLHRSVEQILGAGERAAGLVGQLLAFSRKQVLQQEILDLNELLANMGKMLARLVREDVEVVTRLSPHLEPVLADRHQMEQVIMNLVVNARDAMPRGGAVTIETGQCWQEGPCAQWHAEINPGNYVRLTVRDTGVGMDESTQQHLFEPFFTTKEVGKGTGLGLATVHGIVVQSKGHLSFESTPGKGTVFHVYLPAVQRTHAATEAAPAVATGGSETILLVEDDPLVRRVTAEMLASEGYRVLHAPSGTEALSMLAAGRADLLLTDLVMPKISGVELADRARLLQPGIRVLFTSGYSDEIVPGSARVMAAETFIQKPFSRQALAAKVREVLDRPRTLSRILVVDDELSVRQYLRSVLEGAGYEVAEAADGKQALRYLKTAMADLVITDLVMPEMEGIETLLALRRDYPSIRLIAISGANRGAYLSLARPPMAHGVLAKPVSPEALLREVSRTLGQEKPPHN